MTGSLTGTKLTLSLRAFPNLRLIAQVGEMVERFCDAIVEDADIASRFRVAAHELTENVYKYSPKPSADIELEMEELPDSVRLRLRVANSVASEQLERVTRVLVALRSAEDPVRYYDELIARSVLREGESGLGLARLRAESELDVDFVATDDRLTVIVESSLPRGTR